MDLKSLEAREEAAIRKVKEKDATKGKGVSKEAQEIFDALHKTLVGIRLQSLPFFQPKSHHTLSRVVPTSTAVQR